MKNKIIRAYELPCYDGRKQFYGKAKVMEMENGDKILKSYDTNVIKLNSDGKTEKLWTGYSATSMRHINSFLEHFNLDGGGKKWWNEQ